MRPLAGAVRGITVVATLAGSFGAFFPGRSRERSDRRRADH